MRPRSSDVRSYPNIRHDQRARHVRFPLAVAALIVAPKLAMLS
jgi:hypothetical protein